MDAILGYFRARSRPGEAAVVTPLAKDVLDSIAIGAISENTGPPLWDLDVQTPGSSTEIEGERLDKSVTSTILPVPILRRRGSREKTPPERFSYDIWTSSHVPIYCHKPIVSSLSIEPPGRATTGEANGASSTLDSRCSVNETAGDCGRVQKDKVGMINNRSIDNSTADKRLDKSVTSTILPAPILLRRGSRKIIPSERFSYDIWTSSHVPIYCDKPPLSSLSENLPGRATTGEANGVPATLDKQCSVNETAGDGGRVQKDKVGMINNRSIDHSTADISTNPQLTPTDHDKIAVASLRQTDGDAAGTKKQRFDKSVTSTILPVPILLRRGTRKKFRSKRFSNDICTSSAVHIDCYKPILSSLSKNLPGRATTGETNGVPATLDERCSVNQTPQDVAILQQKEGGMNQRSICDSTADMANPQVSLNLRQPKYEKNAAGNLRDADRDAGTMAQFLNITTTLEYQSLPSLRRGKSKNLRPKSIYPDFDGQSLPTKANEPQTRIKQQDLNAVSCIPKDSFATLIQPDAKRRRHKETIAIKKWQHGELVLDDSNSLSPHSSFPSMNMKKRAKFCPIAARSVFVKDRNKGCEDEKQGESDMVSGSPLAVDGLMLCASLMSQSICNTDAMLASCPPIHELNSVEPITLDAEVLENLASPQQPKPRKNKFSNRGFSHSLEDVYSRNPNLEESVKAYGRVIARRRVYQSNGKYAPWEYIHIANADKKQRWTCDLNRGGTIKMDLDRAGPKICLALRDEVEGCKHLKVYNGRGCHNEPRIHALASNGGGGYRYNTTKMKAFPLAEVPRVQHMAHVLAQENQIDDWNIGVDLLIYRSGDDSIGWHEDDTQDESIILCLVVHAGNQTRTLCIQPNSAPREGDEQIELYAGTGDIYQMDAAMQHHYVHTVLKTKELDVIPGSDSSARRRVALVFRQGTFLEIEKDSGCPVESLQAPDCRLIYLFGELPDLRRRTLYSRTELIQLKAHRTDRRGVSGNATVGVDAIIVKHVNSDHGEADHGIEIFYYANSFLGGGALFYSYLNQQPIRVFRSSGGRSLHSPVWTAKIPQSVYLYGGLYRILRAWSSVSRTSECLLTRDSNAKDAVLFHLISTDPIAADYGVELSRPYPRYVPRHPNILGSALFSPPDIPGDECASLTKYCKTKDSAMLVDTFELTDPPEFDDQDGLRSTAQSATSLYKLCSKWRNGP